MMGGHFPGPFSSEEGNFHLASPFDFDPTSIEHLQHIASEFQAHRGVRDFAMRGRGWRGRGRGHFFPGHCQQLHQNVDRERNQPTFNKSSQDSSKKEYNKLSTREKVEFTQEDKKKRLVLVSEYNGFTAEEVNKEVCLEIVIENQSNRNVPKNA